MEGQVPGARGLYQANAGWQGGTTTQNPRALEDLGGVCCSQGQSRERGHCSYQQGDADEEADPRVVQVARPIRG